MIPVRTVFIGDSHVARLRRALAGFPGDVHNAAAGGASSRDLFGQAVAVGVRDSDAVVLSVGTNDAAPSKHVPVTEFVRLVSMCLASHSPHGWVYVAPPGVVEERLTGEGDRTNSVIDEYRRAAIGACDEAGVQVVRTDLLLELCTLIGQIRASASRRRGAVRPSWRPRAIGPVRPVTAAAR